jgi:hypothetical protein
MRIAGNISDRAAIVSVKPAPSLVLDLQPAGTDLDQGADDEKQDVAIDWHRAVPLIKGLDLNGVTAILIESAITRPSASFV